GWGVLQGVSHVRASQRVETLLRELEVTDTLGVPKALEILEADARSEELAGERLRVAFEEAAKDSRMYQNSLLALALLGRELTSEQLAFLGEWLLSAGAEADLGIAAQVLSRLHGKHHDQLAQFLAATLAPRRIAQTDDDPDCLADRQATAAAALIRLEKADAGVWRLLWRLRGPADDEDEDPRLRTFLIHRLRPFGVPLDELTGRLERADLEPSERLALLLSLGSYKADLESLRPAERERLRACLLHWYEH